MAAGTALAQDVPPGFDQQGGGDGAGNQPPMLVLPGAWTGDMVDPAAANHLGMIHETDMFGPAGQFVSVRRLADGMVVRVSGSYSTSRIGPDQIQVQTQTDQWLPQQICRSPTLCQPVPIPRQAVATVTFIAADTIEVASGANGRHETITQHRDANPVMLSVQPPERYVVGRAIDPAATPLLPTGSGLAHRPQGR